MIYLVTIGLLLGFLLCFVIVEHFAHLFARRHPEFGPPRKLGCGNCACSHKSGKTQCEK